MKVILDYAKQYFHSTIPQVCVRIAIMHMFRHFFDYDMCGGCGFPSIELLGTVDDWELLRENARAFVGKFTDSGLPGSTHMRAWQRELDYVLAEFVAAAKGEPHMGFWNIFVTVGGGSAVGCYGLMTGWIHVIFDFCLDHLESVIVFLRVITNNHG